MRWSRIARPLFVVTLLKSDKLALSYVGVLCENVSGIADLVGVVSFDYCSRVCNDVVHKLAQMGFSLPSKTCLAVDAPNLIQDVLIEGFSVVIKLLFLQKKKKKKTHLTKLNIVNNNFIL